jgi:hypothetical protein
LFVGENAPAGTAISYYLKAPATGGAKISISDVTGRVLCSMNAPGAAGINRIQWTLAAGPSGQGAGRGAGAGNQDTSCSRPADANEASPGAYTVRMTVNGHDYVKIVEVLEDRWLEQR